MKDVINVWLERNDKAFAEAVELLASGIIETIICDVKDLKDDEMLRNATDLAECDYNDITMFFSLLDAKWTLNASYDSVYGKLDKEPYSIKDWCKKELGYGGYKDVFDKWLDDNYEEVLEGDLLTAVNERKAVGCIVNSTAMGGGFEVISDLFLAAKKKVVEIIMRELKPMKPFRAVKEPMELEFFSIEDDGQDGKQVHLLGYTYLSDDNGEGPWRGMEPCGLLIPIEEFVQGMAEDGDYADNLIAEAKQYEGDYTDEGMVDYINHYFSHHPAGHYLHYSEVTADTPVGYYCFENR